jgi:hypothetical protein
MNKGSVDNGVNELENLGDEDDIEDGHVSANIKGKGKGKAVDHSNGAGTFTYPADTQLRSILSQPLTQLAHPTSTSGPAPAPFLSADFHNWTDETATLDHFYTSYFTAEPSLAGLAEAHARERIHKWMSNGRDPKIVAHELWVCDAARKRADREQRLCKERYIEGVDDEELEEIYGMADTEKQMRAETWLAKHSRWMEQARGGYFVFST